MSRAGSNHESKRVESWVKQGRIIGRTGSNHESVGVEMGQIIRRTGSITNRIVSNDEHH